jgi:hypothetical protein
MQTIRGDHDRSTYVRVYCALVRQGRTGVLRVRYRKRSRRLYFLRGQPVFYGSDLEDDGLEKTLVNSRLLPQSKLTWVMTKLLPGDSLEEALLTSGCLEEDTLGAHLLERLRAGAASALRWGTGEWSFEHRPEVEASLVDPRAHPPVGGLEAIWYGIRQHVAVEDVFLTVTNEASGGYRPTPDLAQGLVGLELPESLSQVSQVLGEGCAVNDLFTVITDKSGDLPKLLWFLEMAGLLIREGGEQVPDTLSGLEDNAAERVNGSSGEDLEKLASEVSEEFTRRMGQDFYGFLGLEPDSEADLGSVHAQLKAGWEELGRRALGHPPSLEHIRKLVDTADKVMATLADPERKDEYDSGYIFGEALRVESLWEEEGGS